MYIAFNSMVKFQSLAQFSMDWLLHLVMPSLMLPFVSLLYSFNILVVVGGGGGVVVFIKRNYIRLYI